MPSRSSSPICESSLVLALIVIGRRDIAQCSSKHFHMEAFYQAVSGGQRPSDARYCLATLSRRFRSAMVSSVTCHRLPLLFESTAGLLECETTQIGRAHVFSECYSDLVLRIPWYVAWPLLIAIAALALQFVVARSVYFPVKL